MPETSRKPGSCQARPQLKGKQKVDNRVNMKKDKNRLFAVYSKILPLRTLEAISKKGFWFKVAAGPSFNPQEYYSISRI